MSTDESAGAVPPTAGPRSDPAAGDAAAAPAQTAPAATAAPDVDQPADPTGPPWSIDVVADLQAGRYPDDVAGPLRQRLAADPWAAAAMAALDTTVDELSLLPAPRMPERFALRLDAALAAEARSAAGSHAADHGVPPPRQSVAELLSPTGAPGQQLTGGRVTPPSNAPSFSGLPSVRPSAPLRAVPAPTTPPIAPPVAPAPSPAPGVRRPAVGHTGSVPVPPLVLPPVRSLDAARAKRRRWIGGLAAAAAVIAIGSATVASLQHSPAAPNVAAPAPAGGSALELDPGRFGEALQRIEGKRPAGPLQDTATYNRCLAANTIDPSAVSGVTAVTFQGRSAAAIAVVVDAGHSRIVVVGPNCGIGGAADQLASQTVDR